MTKKIPVSVAKKMFADFEYAYHWLKSAYGRWDLLVKNKAPKSVLYAEVNAWDQMIMAIETAMDHRVVVLQPKGKARLAKIFAKYRAMPPELIEMVLMSRLGI